MGKPLRMNVFPVFPADEPARVNITHLACDLESCASGKAAALVAAEADQDTSSGCSTAGPASEAGVGGSTRGDARTLSELSPGSSPSPSSADFWEDLNSLLLAKGLAGGDVSLLRASAAAPQTISDLALGVGSEDEAREWAAELGLVGRVARARFVQAWLEAKALQQQVPPASTGCVDESPLPEGRVTCIANAESVSVKSGTTLRPDAMPFVPQDRQSLGLPSKGSARHHDGQCKPCAFVYAAGCLNGIDCEYCHLCAPKEQQRRKRVKRAIARRVMQSGRGQRPATQEPA